MEKTLIHNSVTCLKCGETLVSTHTHDYKQCNCDNKTMCDGGLSYCRFGGSNISLIKVNCLYDDSPHEQIRDVVYRMSRGKSGKEKLKKILLKNINDEYLQALIEYEEYNNPQNIFLKIYKNEQKWREKYNIKILS